MGNKTKSTFLSLAILLLGSSFLAFGQAQTGSIRGIITDDQDNPLPGVTVTITSPALMGTLSFVTDQEGRYRFPACPPGDYQIKAEIPGFKTVERKDIIVHVGMTVSINIRMDPTAIEEEVTVTAPSPLVDTRASKLSLQLTDEMVKHVPAGREIYELVKTAASVIDEGPASRTHRKGVSIHGGTLYETKYAMDGVLLEDPSLGSIAMDVSFDSVEEVEIITAGHPAEVGNVSAGYINIVSKSGGNTLSGGLIFQYSGESFQQSTVPLPELQALGLAQPELDISNVDFSFTLGGPIVKDRIWFFANPQVKRHVRHSPFIPFTDTLGTFHPAYDIKKRYYTGFLKLSAQVSKSLKYMGTFGYLDSSEDPSSVISDPKIPYDAQAYVPEKDWHANSVLFFLLNPNTFLEARGSYVFREYQWRSIAERDGSTAPRTYDRYTGYAWGNYWLNEYYGRWKWDVSLNLTRFQDDFLGGDHEFKMGAGIAQAESSSDYWGKNPYNLYWFNGLPWYYHDTTPYMGLVFTYFSGLNRGDSPMKNQFTRYNFYVQDSFTLKRRLTLNIGVRLDITRASRLDDVRKGWVDPYNDGLLNVLLPNVFSTQDIVSPGLKNIIDWSILQPRIGLTYDLFGDGLTALKASYSRYPEAFTTQLMGGLHAFEPYDGAGFIWYDYDTDGLFDLPPIDGYYAYYYARIITDPETFAQKVDPSLSSPYTDELTTGIQRELFKDFSLAVNFIYKVQRNIVETIDSANPLDGDMWLPYQVTDPGDDGKFQTGDDQDLTVYARKQGSEQPFLYKTNVDEARRKYWGIELIMFKRMADNWQLSGSVTYSKSYGNVRSGGWDTTGATGLFTDPNNLINSWGRGTWDRPLIVKLTGTVVLPLGINLSAFYRHLTGAPFEREGRTSLNRTLTVYFPATVGGFAPNTPTVSVMAEPHGSKRTNDLDLLDVRIDKEFSLAFGRLGLMLDVFNVFGYSRLQVNTNVGGYLFANGTFSRFPTAGQVLSVQDGARVARFSIRYSF